MNKPITDFIAIAHTAEGARLCAGGDASIRLCGVCDTTALQFAIEAYVNGDPSVAGRTSVFNGPDTGSDARVPFNTTAEEFFDQYFALHAHYGNNLVRIGAGDSWGTALQYRAWADKRGAYFRLLTVMLEKARTRGVYVALVLAGIQGERPDKYVPFGGLSDYEALTAGSDAFARYAAYCRDMMSAFAGFPALGMFDLFNEPDHDAVNHGFWKGDKRRFLQWAQAVAGKTEGATPRLRTLGVAGCGEMFGWGQEDFDLCTGLAGFEVAHRHYYHSAFERRLFEEPEAWARKRGLPLYWGELANNRNYPLDRWPEGEAAIFDAGGQAVTAMVMNGTPGYPYRGGRLLHTAPH